MLKATQHGQYFKAGRKVITYLIGGPAAEVADYLAVLSSQLNRPVDKLPTVNGQPLLFVVEELEYANGRVPQPSYILEKSRDGSRYYRNTTEQDKAFNNRVGGLIEEKFATIMAERRAGVNRPAVSTTRVAAGGAIQQPATANTDADDIASAVAAGGEGEAVGAAGGQETLAQS